MKLIGTLVCSGVFPETYTFVLPKDVSEYKSIEIKGSVSCGNYEYVDIYIFGTSFRVGANANFCVYIEPVKLYGPNAKLLKMYTSGIVSGNPMQISFKDSQDNSITPQGNGYSAPWGTLYIYAAE